MLSRNKPFWIHCSCEEWLEVWMKSGQLTSCTVQTGLRGSFRCVTCCWQKDWGFIDGTEVLAEDANAQAQAEFQRRSQKTFSTIIIAISTPQLYLVTSCEQTKEAWDSLHNHFERDTLANRLFLKKQYFRTEMKEGSSMEARLKHMKEITDRLTAIGAPISEEDQVVTLLGSLSQSYSTLVTALEARVDDVRLNFVQQALIHEEQKINGHSSITSTLSSVNHGTASALVGAHQKRTKQASRFKCFDCGEEGHFRHNCPRKKEQQRPKPMHRAKPAEEKHSDVDSNSPGAFAVHLAQRTPLKRTNGLRTLEHQVI